MLVTLDHHLASAAAPANVVHSLAFAAAQGRTLQLPTEVRGAVEVEVDSGRWIVKCPYCPNAQLASLSDPRFLCVNCWNQANDGAWLTVTWPDDDTRMAVETALDARPAAGVKRWVPREPVSHLLDENRRMHEGKLPLPPDHPEPPFRLPDPLEDAVRRERDRVETVARRNQ